MIDKAEEKGGVKDKRIERNRNRQVYFTSHYYILHQYKQTIFLKAVLQWGRGCF